MILPPDNVIAYAKAIKDKRERYVALLGISRAFPRTKVDPEWKAMLSAALKESGLKGQAIAVASIEAGVIGATLKAEKDKS